MPRLMQHSYVTGFHITWLPHTQNQTYNFTRNRLLGQCTFTPDSWRMAYMLVVANFSWLCESHDWTFGTIRWSCLSWNCVQWTGTLQTCSLPAVISLNLEWFQCREGPQNAIAWSLDYTRLPSPFITSILTHPHPPPLLLPPVISLPVRKKAAQNEDLYTHTFIANRWMNNWNRFCLHSPKYWEVTTQMIT